MARIELTATHSDVYPPCEDSFALADALAADSREDVLGRRGAALCVEIGCGSGFTAAALMLAAPAASFVIATDISPDAAATTRATLAKHGVQADIVRPKKQVVCDLLQPFRQRLAGTLDVLICNPPYVPTPAEEVGKPGICSAWAGGSFGRVVIDRILEFAPALLREHGVFYLLTIAENKPEEILQAMSTRGVRGCIVKTTKAGSNEKIQILRMIKAQAGDRLDG